MRKTENMTEKGQEKRTETKKRSYFVRLFGKYDFKDKEQFARFGKWILFIVLLTVEIFILLDHIDNYKTNYWQMLTAIIVIETFFTLSQALKLFVFNTGKMWLYAVDAAFSCSFMFLSQGTYPIAVFMIVLTEFYIISEGLKHSIVMVCVGSVIYETGYVLCQSLLYTETFSLLPIFMQSLTSIVALFVHFVIVQVGMTFYRQFLRLQKTLTELDESKRELEKAYAVVAEVTALEERQRIAKDIHDTAGHSITTVIMQTEVAKRILDKNPEEAKTKIIAANLQAKHALEELRDSVHLLSGMQKGETLKTALETIIHESTDGTGLTVRSQIEDVRVSPAKHRFLCNTLKEGISNGLRHGNATAFWFELKEESEKIAFLLSDNGNGVDMDELRLGFGLSAMQERVRALGGEVRFHSEKEEGFELHLFLPSDKKLHEKHGENYANED
ncbi:MAG: sensor histidine kinase [Clostridiales bacterium]|nr:sensor histidine kinase [Clostridiales bacterium]